MKENMQEKKQQNVAQYGIINGKGNNTSIKDKRQKKTTDVMKVRLNMWNTKWCNCNGNEYSDTQDAQDFWKKSSDIPRFPMTVFTKTQWHFYNFSPLGNLEFGLAKGFGKKQGINKVLVFYINNVEIK